MGAGRFRALLEPATMLLLESWSLNLLSESLGRVQKYGFVGLALDLMNQEGRIYIKNNLPPDNLHVWAGLGPTDFTTQSGFDERLQRSVLY